MSVQSNKSQEPSMEEVLASIRRIISEEMENPSRSAPAKSSDQGFEFPWSTADQTSARPVAAQPKLPLNSAPETPAAPAPAIMRHPFMPAPVAPTAPLPPVSAPVADAKPVVTQPVMSNADFLSSYFAEIAQKNAVRGVPETPVPVQEPASQDVAPVSAPAAVAPQPTAQSPFAGIIPSAPLETSVKIQMVPVTVAPVAFPVQTQQQSQAPVAEPVVDNKPVGLSQDAMAEALAAAFVEAKLLPHPAEEVSVPEEPSAPEPDVVPVLEPSMAEKPAEEPVVEQTAVSASGVISDRAAQVLASSLANLTDTVKSAGAEGPYPRLDDFVAELMKPLISDWIDQNLERIVEEAVRDEIKRVSKLARS